MSAHSRGSQALSKATPPWGTRSCLRCPVPSWVCRQGGEAGRSVTLCPVPGPGLAEEQPLPRPPQLCQEERSVCRPSGGKGLPGATLYKRSLFKSLPRPLSPSSLMASREPAGTGFPQSPAVACHDICLSPLSLTWKAHVGRDFAGFLSSAQTVSSVTGHQHLL